MGSQIVGLSDKEYRSLEAESFSSLKNLVKRAKDYFYYKDKPFTGNAATDFGTAIHLLLQGQENYVTFMNKSSKGYEEFKQEHTEKTKGEGVILQQGYLVKFNEIHNELKKAAEILDFVTKFKYEIGFQGVYEGISLKGKVDGLNETSILEIKTYGQGSGLDDFRRLAYLRHYDMQAYMYCMLSGRNKHYTLAISTTAPFTVSLHPASEEYLESGRQKFLKVIDKYKKYVINKEPYEDKWEEL